jgi:Tfp pilus assembly protein PilN
MHVNLLPSSFVWQQLLRKRLRQWAFALAFLFFVLIASNVPLIVQWWVDLQEYQSMQLAAEPARKLQDDRIEITKATLGLKHKIESLQAITARDRGTSLLGLIANSVNATDKTVQIQQLHVSIETKSTEMQSANPTLISNASPARQNLMTSTPVPDHQVCLKLKGIAVESESISKFVDSIQRSGVFPKVELHSMQERMLLDRSIQDFELECFGNE